MKAMILAAGLGTRLKPWTLEHPKALVPVGGIPMLERVIIRLRDSGFDRIVVNIHHFGEQITDFLGRKDFGIQIAVSDESGRLLDTGGGILNAEHLLCADGEPFLVHNVDILSDADLRALMQHHSAVGSLATLLVSPRDSSRRIFFDSRMMLRGWKNCKTGEYRPENFRPHTRLTPLAFSGIHALSVGFFDAARRLGFGGAFPIMDFYLKACGDDFIGGYREPDLHLIDIGKPETLSLARAEIDRFTTR